MPRFTVRRTRALALAALSAGAAGSLAFVPAAYAYTSFALTDGFRPGSDAAAASSTDGEPIDLLVLRDGAVVASGDGGGATDVVIRTLDVAPGDVFRFVEHGTQTPVGEVTYDGTPAVVACPGSTTFSGLRHASTSAFVHAYPDPDAPADPTLPQGLYPVMEYTEPGRFEGWWSTSFFETSPPTPLPASFIVNVSTPRMVGEPGSPGAVAFTTFVLRRASDLCPAPEPAPALAPAAPASSAPDPAPAAAPPAAPPARAGASPAPGPEVVTRELLAAAVRRVARHGVAGIAKTQRVPLVVAGAGTVQIQQFSGAAPTRATVFSARAKGLPRNLIASGGRRFATPGAGTVKVTPTARAKAVVAGRKRLAVTVRVVFRPQGGGAAVAQDQRVALTRER